MSEIVILSEEDIITENFRQTGIICDEERKRLWEHAWAAFIIIKFPSNK